MAKVKYAVLIMDYASTHNQFTAGDISKCLNITYPEAYRYLQQLVYKNNIQQIVQREDRFSKSDPRKIYKLLRPLGTTKHGICATSLAVLPQNSLICLLRVPVGYTPTAAC